jgi:NTE family protein
LGPTRGSTKHWPRPTSTPIGSLAKLREFWQLVSGSAFGDLGRLLPRGDAARALAQQMSAGRATMLGVPGFYAPRIPSILFQAPGTLEATSFYDTAPLKATLAS